MKKDFVSPIVVLGAMDIEITEIEHALQDAETHTVAGYRFTEGYFEGKPVVAVRCLIGMVHSAAAVTLAIQTYHPSFVLLQGTSGGHSPKLHQYDIVLGENLFATTVFWTPHRDAGQGSKIEDWTYPGVQTLIDGKKGNAVYFHGDEKLMALAEKVPYSRGKVVRGTIGTGEIWVRELDRIRFCHEHFGTDCEEMEGFAVAQVCAQFGVPTLDIRVISNSELFPEEAFSEDTALACQKFCLDFLHSFVQKFQK